MVHFHDVAGNLFMIVENYGGAQDQKIPSMIQAYNLKQHEHLTSLNFVLFSYKHDWIFNPNVIITRLYSNDQFVLKIAYLVWC